MDTKPFRLCYVEGPWAYFTTCPLDKQWGDDWNDAPYEHNCGEPYLSQPGIEPYQIIKVAYEGPFQTPRDIVLDAAYSPWSVEMINAGQVPWLQSSPWCSWRVEIMAGVTFEEFVNLIYSGRGKVYGEIIYEPKQAI